MGRWFGLAVVALIAGLIALPSISSADSPTSTLSLGVPPPAANDPSCRPTAGRSPVVLLHGTRADMTINWQYMSPELAAAGWCVWALDFEGRGTVEVERSAARLAQFVRMVRRVTGSARVSLVGHSLGGLIARQFVRRNGGRKLVDDLVSLGTPQYGYHSDPPFTIVDAVFNTGCPACLQIEQESPFMAQLNSGNPTPGPVSYTQVITRNDEISTPVSNQELPRSRRSVNVYLEDACPDHMVDHLMLAYDPLVRDWIVNALSRRGRPANLRRDVTC